MTSEEQYKLALYVALKDRSVVLLYSELEDALKEAAETQVYEYGHKAVGCTPVVDSLTVVKDRAERWGDKIMRRVKAGPWEEVEG